MQRKKLYDIRSEFFEDPSSNHHLVFFFNATDDVLFVFEGSKRLTTVEGPVLIPFIPPPGGSSSASRPEPFRFFGVREVSGRSGSWGDGNWIFFPFSQWLRWRRYIAIVALASVTCVQT
jgi:hypothetical protein